LSRLPSLHRASMQPTRVIRVSRSWHKNKMPPLSDSLFLVMGQSLYRPNSSTCRYYRSKTIYSSKNHI
jgi:hypothetical protein